MDVRETVHPPERLHALDALRGFALLLGVVFHATMSFLPTAAPVWAVADSHPSMTLAVICFAIHLFRMTTFFLVAGLFARMSFHRLGASRFIADRLQRIAVPLVAGWPILFGAIFAISLWSAAATPDADPARLPPLQWPAFPNFPLTHLWFLYLLLEFYAGALLLRGAVALMDPAGRLRAGVDRLVGALMRGPLAPVVLGAPVCLAFAGDPNWPLWFGMPTPNESLVSNPTALIGYAVAFGFGWLLHRQLDLLRILERRWALNLALAIALAVVCIVLAGVSPDAEPIPRADVRLFAAACYALGIWTSTFAVIGLALRFLSNYSPVRRYIADSSYWLYLVHLPIVLALQALVARADWHWLIKFAFILALAFPTLFASYHFLVRGSVIGAVLNGRRRPRRAAPAGSMALASR